MPSTARADVFSFILTIPLHYMQTRKFCKYSSKLHISTIHNARSFIKLSSFSTSVSLSPEKRSWNEKKLCFFFTSSGLNLIRFLPVYTRSLVQILIYVSYLACWMCSVFSFVIFVYVMGFVGSLFYQTCFLFSKKFKKISALSWWVKEIVQGYCNLEIIDFVKDSITIGLKQANDCFS